MKSFYLFIFCVSFFYLSAQGKQTNGFYENKGQIVDQKGRANPAVKYLLNTAGINVQLRQNGFSYDVFETKKVLRNKSKNNPYSSYDDLDLSILDFPSNYTYHRIDIDFLNSNKNVSFETSEPTVSYSNYYMDGKSETTNVRAFKKVTYKEIYPNIDVVFIVPEDDSKATEYNFIIHPGGNASDIKMKFSGANTKLTKNKINMRLRFGEMQEILPASWIENGSEKKDIDVSYKQLSKNVYGFAIADIGISGKTIIIDPVPVRLWGTYFGGAGDDYSGDILLDTNQDLIISGSTRSTTNIATAGSYQTSLSGLSNGYFAKFTPNGILLWCTYFPIAGRTQLDYNDNIYIGGKTMSNTLATPGAYQQSKNNYEDTFIIKLNSMGFREWATYYGGNGNEELIALTVDKNNNVYIVGSTSSTNVLSSVGAHQEVNNTTTEYLEAFAAKFSPSGNRVWGTFYGGAKNDTFYTCSISDDNYLYMAGLTRNPDHISTPGSYKPVYDAVFEEGMLIKFDLDGQRVWGTYFGSDQVINRMVLKGNDAYMTGRTFAVNGIGTAGTFHENYISGMGNGGGNDYNSFFIKFDLQSQQKKWGTYFFDLATSIVINQNNELYLCGYTSSNTGVATPDAFMPEKGFASKSFIIKLTASGQRQWGTYVGGNGGSQLGRLALDNSGGFYFFATSFGATTGIATPGAHSTTLGSNPDAYLIKFKDCHSSTTTSSSSPTCLNDTIRLTASGGTNYSWTGPNGFTSTLQNPTIPNAAAIHSGQYSCLITGTGGCDNTGVTDIIVGDSMLPVADLNLLPDVNGTCSVTISSFPTATDNCSGVLTATTNNPLTYNLPGTYTIIWKYTDASGNTTTQNQKVIVAANADPITPILQYAKCDADADGKESFDLTSKQSDIINLPDYTFSYYRNISDALIQNDAITTSNNFQNQTNPQTIYVRVLNTINGCSALSELILTVDAKPIVNSASLTKCDTAKNEIQDFDLRDAVPDINAATGMQFDYFTSMQNLNDGIPIGNFTSFQNSTNNQKIFVKVTDAKGCFNITELTLIVAPIQLKVLSDFVECDDDYDGKFTFNLTVKHNEIMTLLPGGNYIFTNHINQNDALLGVAAYQNQFTNTNSSETLFIRVSQMNRCPIIYEVALRVLDKPILNFKDRWALCEGKSVTLSAENGFDKYQWSNGITTQSSTFLNPGDYSITVSKTYGTYICSTTQNFTIVNSNVATINNITTLDWTNTENVITVFADGDGIYEYSLDGNAYQASNQFSGLQNGLYTVYVKDINGCGITSEEIYLLMYPKFFTPNGDGINDHWKIHFSVFEPSLDVKIFDRYGKFLKQLFAKDEGWDGTYNNNPLPATDYWFVVKRADGKEHRGHFTLKR